MDNTDIVRLSTFFLHQLFRKEILKKEKIIVSNRIETHEKKLHLKKAETRNGTLKRIREREEGKEKIEKEKKEETNTICHMYTTARACHVTETRFCHVTRSNS